MRRSLGTAVFSGMIGVTLFGVFLTPVFFFVLMSFGPTRPAGPRPAPVAAEVAGNAEERQGGRIVAAQPPPPESIRRAEDRPPNRDGARLENGAERGPSG